MTAHKIYIGIILLLIILFSIDHCSLKKEAAKSQSEALNFSDSVKLIHLKDSTTIAENKALLVVDENTMMSVFKKNDALSQELKKFKSIVFAGTISAEAVIRHDTIPYAKHDTVRFSIPCEFEPIHVVNENKNYEAGLTITKDEVVIDSLKIPSTLSYIVGIKEMGFFKNNQLVVNSRFDNPLITITNQKSFIYKPQTKIYDTFTFKVLLVAAGVITGVYISK